jgi:phosphonopyruvate decarboxylase
MIKPSRFYNTLKQYGSDFYAGVPDSLLKYLCAYITDNSDANHHIITANEGGAIGIAAGYYLSTGKIPIVYMQNSGLGNTVNPLLSLMDGDVYNIPVLLIIGWRGQPGIKDEPQHIKQGKVTLPLLDAMGVKYDILTTDETLLQPQIEECIQYMKRTNKSYAFVVRKGTFDEYSLQNNIKIDFPLTRENAIDIVAASLNPEDVIVSTTGMISRELFEYRTHSKGSHERDFLTVGSMGHASQIALGIALQKKDRKVYCFDGDGAAIMHMGGLAIIGTSRPQNYIHVIFNNGAHDSVGGQPTVGLKIDLAKIVLASGYQYAQSVDNEEDLRQVLSIANNLKGPILIEVKVKKGARKDLGRPTSSPIKNKEEFIEFLRQS